MDCACRRGGGQLGQALPLRELRLAADVVGQALVPGALPREELGVIKAARHGPPRRAALMATRGRRRSMSSPPLPVV
ncbi:hypothetical protein [Streptomyces marianii]|uniref:hypothetical protein n=1 Tax=Streptomyces marianii TaxID=1817406 RepID=UPI001486A4BA|nr:hypothetical protein [Streptomyces marianii]